MNNLDKQLKKLYLKILDKNKYKTDRTGVGTKSIFGHQMRFDLREGFPLTTLRKIHIKSLIHELLWFLGSYDSKYKKFGNTNIKYLLDHGVTFWTEWAYEEYYRQKRRTYELNNKNNEKEFKFLNIKDFEKKIKTDDDFALKWGDLGRVYGAQWIDWGGEYEMIEKSNILKETKSEQFLINRLGWEKIYIKGTNQINKLINDLIEEPDSRRLIVNSWNVSEIDDMLLAPCHILFQCYTEILTIEERIEYCKKHYSEKDIREYMKKNDIDCWEDIEMKPIKQIKILDHFNVPERWIDMQMYQRSQDVYLGQPYNIASYSLLLHMIAQCVNMIPREFVWTGGDVHLYSNSIDATKQLLQRDIRPLPKLKINPDIENIYGFRYEDFEIIGYDPHPNIKVDVAV